MRTPQPIRSIEMVRVILLVTIAASAIAGCGSKLKVKEGSFEDLLNASDDEEVPLETQSLMVEKIATELEVQKDEYRIGPNDVLNITVLDHEEVSSVRDFNRGIVGTIVKKDGKIYLPIVGPLQAEGYTIEEFHEVLREKLSTYILEPQVTVDMFKYESKRFYVLGMVNAPGAFPVDGKTTLLDALGLAKGIKPEGSLEQAYVVRDRALLPISLADLLIRGDTSRNIYMKKNDLVYIPSSLDQKVYVLGEVEKPGVVQIPNERLTLAQAIAEVGGVRHVEADRGSIKLIRGSWKEPIVYTIKFDAVLTHGDRVLLKPGDRIFVQPTGLTTASRYMQQLLPFLQAADSGTAVYDRVRR